jgi:hypothetical protein
MTTGRMQCPSCGEEKVGMDFVCKGCGAWDENRNQASLVRRYGEEEGNRVFKVTKETRSVFRDRRANS